jgi:hypothetical protein
VSAAALRILFLGANPSDSTRLALDREFRAIRERLRATPHGARFQLEQEWAVRTKDLQAALLRHRPDIVHFSGHGAPAADPHSDRRHEARDIAPATASAGGGLIVEDERGGSVELAPAALESLLGIVGGIRCVVLNACFSALQGEALCHRADSVVAMSDRIGDGSAIAFSSSFYQALGFGESVQRAFELGKNQIALENLPDDAVPRLLTRDGVTAASLQLLPADPRAVGPRRRWGVAAAAARAGLAGAGAIVVGGRDRPASAPDDVAASTAAVTRDGGVAGTAALAALAAPLSGPASPPGMAWIRPGEHLGGFHLDRREVTVAEFAAWLRREQAHFAPHAIEIGRVVVARSDGVIAHDPRGFRARSGYAERPVVDVSWDGAMRFCAARGATLPTPDQWAAAAQRVGGAADATGSPEHCSDVIIERWQGGACGFLNAETLRAGEGKRDRTPEGVVDLLGNVSEWTLGAGDDPGSHEVRGGSYASTWLRARPATRAFARNTAPDIGFRCAVSPVDEIR